MNMSELRALIAERTNPISNAPTSAPKKPNQPGIGGSLGFLGAPVGRSEKFTSLPPGTFDPVPASHYFAWRISYGNTSHVIVTIPAVPLGPVQARFRGAKVTPADLPETERAPDDVAEWLADLCIGGRIDDATFCWIESRWGHYSPADWRDWLRGVTA